MGDIEKETYDLHREYDALAKERSGRPKFWQKKAAAWPEFDEPNDSTDEGPDPEDVKRRLEAYIKRRTGVDA